LFGTTGPFPVVRVVAPECHAVEIRDGRSPETVGACLDCLPEACVVVSHATGVGFRRRFHAPVHGIGDVITVEILGAGVL
jgi:hypothetical protein